MDKFDFHEMPQAFFCDNNNANNLRKQLIKNQVRISECKQGNLENIFFSNDNMDLINKQLIMAVYNKSNKQFKINYQSSDKLLIVMRYVFIEYARHLPYDIMKQVKDLNCRVVSEILPNIITNITQNINYLKEINQPRQLLELPKNVNKVKNLKSITSVLFNDK
jgi:hypothetical protein